MFTTIATFDVNCLTAITGMAATGVIINRFGTFGGLRKVRKIRNVATFGILGVTIVTLLIGCESHVVWGAFAGCIGWATWATCRACAKVEAGWASRGRHLYMERESLAYLAELMAGTTNDSRSQYLGWVEPTYCGAFVSETDFDAVFGLKG